MGGKQKISTLGVIRRGLPSPYSRSKMATVLVDTPRVSGQLSKKESILQILMQCCSTCLLNVTFPTKEQDKRYTASNMMALHLVMKN
jgi:hypothetical protein